MDIEEYWATWATPLSSNSHNLLDENKLNALGIQKSDISSMRTYISTPDEPFTVPGLARPRHPVYISGGAIYTLNDGRTCVYEELYYGDEGHKDGKLKDIKHYNQEVRATDISGDTKIYDRKNDPYGLLEDHVIPHSDYIELHLPPVNPGDEQKTKRVRWKSLI